MTKMGSSKSERFSKNGQTQSPKLKKGKEAFLERLEKLENETHYSSTSHSLSDLPPSRARAVLSRKALEQNYDCILEKSGNNSLWMIPMVKANAYGHGVGFAVNALKNKESLYGFGVASLEEGSVVRDHLGMRDRQKRVIVFSGAAHFTEEKAHFAQHYGLECVLHSKEDLQFFLKRGYASQIKYHLKFNTGMNRLGIAYSQLEHIIKLLKEVSPEYYPSSICTHLAIAEDPSDPLTLIQINRFKEIRKQFLNKKENLHFHFANSSAIWNAKHYSLSSLSEIIRPGLSLYGVPPFEGAVNAGLQPVLNLQYQVLALQDLSVGDRVGYGGTYRVSGKDFPHGQKVAILGAGYADGLLRANSSHAVVFHKGMGLKMLGRVSMDLSAIEASPSMKCGDWVDFLGHSEVDPWTQAKSAGTIPYEVFTSISNRVKRIEKN